MNECVTRLKDARTYRTTYLAYFLECTSSATAAAQITRIYLRAKSEYDESLLIRIVLIVAFELPAMFMTGLFWMSGKRKIRTRKSG